MTGEMGTILVNYEALQTNANDYSGLKVCSLALWPGKHDWQHNGGCGVHSLDDDLLI